MDIGEVALAGSVACSICSVALTLPAARQRVPGGARLSRALALASFAMVTIALMTITWLSISSDFEYEYVWEHSSADLDAVYRLSAVWAGGEGSLLVCAWLISLVLVAEVFVRGPARGTSQSFRDVFASTMSLLVVFFSLTVLMSGLFDRTDPALLLAFPDGRGLDVVLQTPEMVLHAPLIFGAYASFCAVFAASTSYHVTGERLWFRTALPWGRLAWLAMTAGIGLGAVWAYYVIGWGGYWSWDPVETSSLIPWFLITAFLHTQQGSSNRREYPIASPLFGMLSLVGVVFVSFVVRAGGVWRSSIHDYGASSEPSAASRLLSLLGHEPSVAGTLAFLLLLLGLSLALSYRALRRAPGGPVASSPVSLSEYITDRNNMSLTVVLMVTSALSAATLMFMNIESELPETALELNQKMSVLFVAIMVVMSLCLTWRLLGKRRALALSVALVGLSASLAVVGAFSDEVDGLVAFALPSFLCAVGASAARLLQSVLKGPARRRIHGAGANVAHLGVALLLAAFVVSSNLQISPSEEGALVVEPDSQIVVGDYIVWIVSFEVTDQVDGYPAGVVEVRAAVVDVYRSGKLIEDDARIEILYGEGQSAGGLVLESVAFVHSSLSEDLYMNFDWMSGSSGLLRAKVVPMMVPLWAGLVLLLAGLGMRLFTAERGSPS